MRKIFLILIITLIGCKSKKVVIESNPKIVKTSEVENFIISRAEDIATRLLDACNTSKLKAFSSEEATEKVIQNATPNKIPSTCRKINSRNGKFIGLKLLDITYNPSNDSYLFRYLIDYEKKVFKRELFITINSDNKVSAISTKEVRPKPF